MRRLSAMLREAPTIWRFMALFCATLAVPVCGPSAAPAPHSLVTEAVIGQSVYLPVVVHGHAGTMVLDTGTDKSWVFPSALARLGIPVMEASTGVHGLTRQLLDSVTIGTIVLHNLPVAPAMGLTFAAPPGMAPVIGLLGVDILSHFDLLFDGPSQRVRVYEASTEAFPPDWLPPGVRRSDCLSAESDFHTPDRLFFPVEVNRHAVHGMLDAGSLTTNMNMPAAHALGITTDAQNVQLLPAGAAPQFLAYRGQKVWLIRTGLTLTTGAHAFSATPTLVYQHLPREVGLNDPELSIGLDAVRNQLFFESNSQRLVCLSAPSAGRLTADDLAKMTTFWTSFMNEPAAIRNTARFQNQTPLFLHLDLGTTGIRYANLVVVDMNAMAAKIPSVAADFQRAGLTPERWTVLRRALYSAFIAQQILQMQGNSGDGRLSDSTSVMAQNVAFLQAHQAEVSSLQQAGMWFPPVGKDSPRTRY